MKYLVVFGNMYMLENTELAKSTQGH